MLESAFNLAVKDILATDEQILAKMNRLMLKLQTISISA